MLWSCGTGRVSLLSRTLPKANIHIHTQTQTVVRILPECFYFSKRIFVLSSFYYIRARAALPSSLVALTINSNSFFGWLFHIRSTEFLTIVLPNRLAGRSVGRFRKKNGDSPWNECFIIPTVRSARHHKWETLRRALLQSVE